MWRWRWRNNSQLRVTPTTVDVHNVDVIVVGSGRSGTGLFARRAHSRIDETGHRCDHGGEWACVVAVK